MLYNHAIAVMDQIYCQNSRVNPSEVPHKRSRATQNNFLITQSQMRKSNQITETATNVNLIPVAAQFGALLLAKIKPHSAQSN
ncbi:hypothetical protein DSO57_1029500 [Entomophthora muscae]|uniref:Uncharacterized protein n=1 Tax=Entomophthora muscae TaxID=34485 RepID=A0ACC2ULQ8_9FUNG|nr:hypothetical protein DSO57_1029500 [Entomophthora muscae]